MNIAVKCNVCILNASDRSDVNCSIFYQCCLHIVYLTSVKNYRIVNRTLDETIVLSSRLFPSSITFCVPNQVNIFAPPSLSNI